MTNIRGYHLLLEGKKSKALVILRRESDGNYKDGKVSCYHKLAEKCCLNQ